MKFLVKVFAFLKIIFKKLKGFNEKYVFPALHVLTLIRLVLQSDEADWLVNLTKSDWDNKLRDKWIKKLAQSILFLKIDIECKGKKEFVDIINCFIEHLKGQPPLIQDAILNKLGAVMVMKSLPPNKQIAQNEADLIVQMTYSTNKQFIKTQHMLGVQLGVNEEAEVTA